jgi:RNA polymerase sigma factor (sigma-70 family)
MRKTDDIISTDKDIIDGFLDGNQICYHVITGWIDEIIQRILWSDSIHPDDIRSDTLYKLLLNFRSEQFQHKSTLKAYVQQVTRFTLIDAIRRQKRQPCRITNDPPASENPYTITITEEEKIIFGRVWNLIDDKCKELWTMIFDKRMHYSKIAVLQNVKESTIKTRVFRCKEEAINIRKHIT